MNCSKCNYGNRRDALYCQQCGALIRRQAQKVVVLQRASSNKSLPHQLLGYYAAYALCGSAGSVVVAVVAFLFFLSVCNYVGITDPAGNTDALLVLTVCGIAVLAVYGVLAVRTVKARMSKARCRMPSYRRDPSARL